MANNGTMNRLEATLLAIDDFNAADPNIEVDDGQEIAKEQLYSQRMSALLAELCQGASDELEIAVRAQHIGRWKLSRAGYPEGRAGYKTWRSELAELHARLTREIMLSTGYGEASADRVSTLLRKRGLKSDNDVQLLEDCACLVFIRFYLRAFAAKHERDKLVAIIGKTWKKMSKRAQQRALELPLDADLSELVAAALA